MFKNIKSINKKYLLITLGIVVLFAVVRSAFKPGNSQQNTLVIGMMSGWAPFMTVNQAGEFEGFDVDVAKKIADSLGKKLVIKDFGSLSTLLVALQQNKIDFVMSGLDITTNRLQSMDMIPYTGQTVQSFYLLFWNKIPDGVTSIQDLQIRDLKNPDLQDQELQKNTKSIICSEPGSPQAKYLDQFKLIEQKSLSKIEDMVLDIKYGKSLAMLVEPQVAQRFMCKNPEIKKLELTLPKDFQTFGMGIGFVKSSSLSKNALSKKVNDIIRQMRNDGTLQILENRWGLEIGEQK